MKFLQKLFGSEGKYKGIEICDSCIGLSGLWKMNIDGDKVSFTEKDDGITTYHSFSKKELDMKDNEFYFYEKRINGTWITESSLFKPDSTKFEKVKIIFGAREVRILAEGRNIVFSKCLF
ncbi:hypothetical protein [Burkholderia multivorans]|uniref:hypothetical protein n=1 Tax=Burkholderia multivorans TaxID=87883 RepID=UPI001C211827|nr:hypothetical protein [Burkholderia multivorans]MBU9553874.1 hypothetical protein [Burkholderia multivorans]